MSDPMGPGTPPQPPGPPQGPPAGQQPGYGGPAGQYQAPRTNGLAVTSLVLGILWVCGLGSILAVIFGHVAMSQINKSNGAQQGKGLAIAGLVLGYLGVSSLILLIAVGEWTWSFNTNT